MTMTETNEVESEEVIRARIAAAVTEAIKLIGKPGAFTDEELEADDAEMVASEEWASKLS
jgi:hypothetical protein